MGSFGGADSPSLDSNHGRMLPIHPHPHNDEIFSNWGLELASGNFRSFKEFFALLGIHLSFSDFENPNEYVIRSLEMVTGATREEILRTLPSSFKAVWKPQTASHWYRDLYSAEVSSPHSRFVRAQYCSQCLALYGCYQVRWRFAIYDCCPIHGLLLRTSCSHCGSQIQDQGHLYDQLVIEPRTALSAC